jgi:hypothetical protein
MLHYFDRIQLEADTAGARNGPATIEVLGLRWDQAQ